MDKFERRYGVVLPHSFSSFMPEIGPGTFRGYFNIATPTSTRTALGLGKLLRKLQGNELFARIYGDESFVARMIPFGTTIGDDVLVWDPKQKIAERTAEYSVFVLPRDSRRILKLSTDFKAFIDTAVFGRQFEKRVFGRVDPNWKIDYECVPFSQPASKRKRTTAPERNGIQ